MKVERETNTTTEKEKKMKNLTTTGIATITRVGTRPDPYGYVTITVAGHRFHIVRDMFGNVQVKGIGSVSGLLEELRWAYGIAADLDGTRILNGLDRSVARWHEDHARWIAGRIADAARGATS